MFLSKLFQSKIEKFWPLLTLPEPSQDINQSIFKSTGLSSETIWASHFPLSETTSCNVGIFQMVWEAYWAKLKLHSSFRNAIVPIPRITLPSVLLYKLFKYVTGISVLLPFNPKTVL